MNEKALDAPCGSAGRPVQVSLFDPLPCAVCLELVEPHWLPNYPGSPWVAAHGPKCGPLIYAPTREAVVMDWNQANQLAGSGPNGG